MGGFISAVGSIFGGGGVKDLVLGVIDRIKLNPETRAKIEAQLAQNEYELRKIDAELQRAVLEQQSKEIEIASANIRAETESGDKYTSRSRPTFIYMMIFVLGWNYVAVPLFHHTPLDFPEALFWLFGSCMLGYTGARTWEKVGTTLKK